MPRPTILFDGECNLCNGFVDFVIRRDRAGRFQFAPLQSEFARRALAHGAPAPARDSVVLLESGRVYVESTAALRIFRRLSAGWPLLYALIVVPAFLRDAAYRWIARNRYRWFGRRPTCRVPGDGERGRFIS